MRPLPASHRVSNCETGVPIHRPCLTFAFCSPNLTSRKEEVFMDQQKLFLKFWDKEAPAFHKVLSRIPEGNYRPDPKSRTAREIAWLIVREQQILADGL